MSGVCLLSPWLQRAHMRLTNLRCCHQSLLEDACSLATAQAVRLCPVSLCACPYRREVFRACSQLLQARAFIAHAHARKHMRTDAILAAFMPMCASVGVCEAWAGGGVVAETTPCSPRSQQSQKSMQHVAHPLISRNMDAWCLGMSQGWGWTG